MSESTERQKVIKTTQPERLMFWPATGQKAPSAKRCIKTTGRAFVMPVIMVCQKAPSAKRCIKTGRRRRASEWRSRASESTERQTVH